MECAGPISQGGLATCISVVPIVLHFAKWIYISPEGLIFLVYFPFPGKLIHGGVRVVSTTEGADRGNRQSTR